MRLLLKITALPLVCIILGSCAGGSNNSAWSPFTSAEGGFTINLPTNPKPVVSQKTEVTAFGKQVVHFVSWKPNTFSIDKFKLFQVSFTDCPARFVSDSIMTDVMLDSSIRMRKKDFTEKEIPSESIELNGYPGRSFMYEVPHDNNLVIVKECITNNRKYDLVVIARRDEGTNAEISEFFNSFQALK